VKRAVTVEVSGQKFTLKTDADEAYVRSLAALVDEKMTEVRAGSRTFSTHAVAIMAALHLADELMQVRQHVRDKSTRILEMLDEARRT
jgi:cell division protein ZapA